MDILTFRELLPEYQRAVPVSVIAICKALKLRVYRIPEWPDELSGKIQRDAKLGGRSGFAIFVNSDHVKTRQRFTIAHEVAHFVLHRSLIGDGITDDALYRSRLSNTLEAEANRLAADILMPRHLVKEEIERGADSVQELASRFEVSLCAMSIRLGVPA